MPYVKIGNIETDTWPPEDSETELRLNNYRKCRKLFKGKHHDVFERVQKWLEREADNAITYVVCNFAGLISKVSADMLFGERLKVVAGDPGSKEQDLVNEIIKQNKLQTLNYEMALSNSWRGDVIYKVRYGAGMPGQGERAIIEATSPSYFFPVMHPDNVRGLEGGDFAWIKERGEKKYLRIERQQPGQIINELWQLESRGGKILKRVNYDIFPEYKDMEEEQETRFPGLLFHHVPNWRLDDEFWGVTDYYDMESIFDELNNRVSRISRVLDKHESPKLILPPGIMKYDEKTERWYVEKEDLEAIEIDKDDKSVGDLPKYLTWDAQLEAAFKQIDKLLEIAFLVSETSPDAFGMGDRGAAESGRALKFRLIRTLAKINRKKLYFDEALKNVISTAVYLENSHGGKDINPDKVDIRLEWADGIPDDPMEQATIEKIRTGGKATSSRKSSIRRLDDLEGQDLEDEITAIEEDEVGEATVPGIGGANNNRNLNLFGEGNEGAE